MLATKLRLGEGGAGTVCCDGKAKGDRPQQSKVNDTKWVYDPGAFKLGHLQSTKPIFAYNIFTL